MSAIKRFLSDTVIYGFTTIVSRLLNFLLTPVFIERISGTAGYGVFTVMYAWASMFNAVLAFGMETTYFRYLQKVKPEQRSRVYDQSFLITCFSSIVFSISVWIFQEDIAQWLGGEGSRADYVLYIQLFLGILVADALAVVPFARLRAENRPIRYAALKLINIVVNVSLNILFLFALPEWVEQYGFWRNMAVDWFLPDNIVGNIFLANLMASLVTLLCLLPEILRLRLKPERKLLAEMLWYSFPILIANISFIINEHLDKIMLPQLIAGSEGERDVGVYGAVSKLAIFLQLFIMAFRLGAEPFFFAYAKNENARKTYASIMEYFVLIMIVIMLGISANLDWLKFFINKPDNLEEQARYWSGLSIVPVLLFNYILLGIYINLSVWYKLSDQTRYGLYISGIGALITIVFNLILIPRYSYVGAAMCTTITYLTMVTLSYLWGQRNYPIPYPVLRIVSYMGVGVLFVWLIGGALDFHVVYSNLIVIAFIGFVLWRERAALRQLRQRI